MEVLEPGAATAVGVAEDSLETVSAGVRLIAGYGDGNDRVRAHGAACGPGVEIAGFETAVGYGVGWSGLAAGWSRTNTDGIELAVKRGIANAGVGACTVKLWGVNVGEAGCDCRRRDGAGDEGVATLTCDRCHGWPGDRGCADEGGANCWDGSIAWVGVAGIGGGENAGGRGRG
ncbi:MAG: hypothetical protein JWP44_4408 [Mucilaginibacter sp.]|nr:hypothetical protein [Mucilaginibacter sp.]